MTKPELVDDGVDGTLERRTSTQREDAYANDGSLPDPVCQVQIKGLNIQWRCTVSRRLALRRSSTKTEYVASSPAVTLAAPVPLTEHVASETAFSCAALVPVLKCVEPSLARTCAAPVTEHASTSPATAHAAPTPGIEYVSPAPAGTCAAPVTEYASTSPAAAYAAPTPGNGEEEDTQSEDEDGGHLLDLVYDAVMNGESPYELQRTDGTLAKSMKRWAPGTKWGFS